MARKIVIATHGKLAMGLRDSLQLLACDQIQIDVINAFSEDPNPKATICDYIKAVSEEDTILALTDIMYGSVNQMFLPYVGKRKNFHLVTGVNLAIAIELILCPEEKMTSEFIEESICRAKGEIKYVNNEVSKTSNNDDAEDFFV